MQSIIVKTVNSDLKKFEKKIETTLDGLAYSMSKNASVYMENVFDNSNYLFNISTT